MVKNVFFSSLLVLFLGCCKKATVAECKEPSKSISGCQNTLTKTEMNGVSLVSISSPIDSSNISPIKKYANANSVAVIPFGFIRSGQANVEYNISWQWYGEKRQGAIEQIQLSHDAGLKVLLKPHLWVIGTWVGDLDFTDTNDWQTFENTYTTYIIDFAKIADSMNVETFCVGVELKKSVVKRPAFWNQLIDSIRSVYSGKLVYAANWDNYENVTFWNKLDFIGIDAYFPVSPEQTPSFESCYDGWKQNYDKIKAKSLNENRKVIFTEFGYRNIDYTGKEPWDEENNSTNNPQAQINAYEAIFCRFWGEPWFEGGFLWKWYPNHSGAGGNTNNRFTPQNKPVQEIIKEIYSTTNE